MNHALQTRAAPGTAGVSCSPDDRFVQDGGWLVMYRYRQQPAGKAADRRERKQQ